jgi:hypothetical protein
MTMVLMNFLAGDAQDKKKHINTENISSLILIVGGKVTK